MIVLIHHSKFNVIKKLKFKTHLLCQKKFIIRHRMLKGEDLLEYSDSLSYIEGESLRASVIKHQHLVHQVVFTLMSETRWPK